MGKGDHLGEFEQLVLLAILRLGGESYGMAVRRELSRTAERTVAIGSVYATLERLEEKGMVSSRLGDPEPVKGGRARRFFRIEPQGQLALSRSREMMSRMWDGVDLVIESRKK